uniref:Uncharacterized protein n=1 Tax=Anguilla anguilla TaxID=7936 RepID=A0A0E9V2W6_ANGAN
MCAISVLSLVRISFMFTPLLCKVLLLVIFSAVPFEGLCDVCTLFPKCIV